MSSSDGGMDVVLHKKHKSQVSLGQLYNARSDKLCSSIIPPEAYHKNIRSNNEAGGVVQELKEEEFSCAKLSGNQSLSLLLLEAETDGRHQKTKKAMGRERYFEYTLVKNTFSELVRCQDMRAQLNEETAVQEINKQDATHVVVSVDYAFETRILIAVEVEEDLHFIINGNLAVLADYAKALLEICGFKIEGSVGAYLAKTLSTVDSKFFSKLRCEVKSDYDRIGTLSMGTIDIEQLKKISAILKEESEKDDLGVPKTIHVLPIREVLAQLQLLPRLDPEHLPPPFVMVSESLVEDLKDRILRAEEVLADFQEKRMEVERKKEHFPAVVLQQLEQALTDCERELQEWKTTKLRDLLETLHDSDDRLQRTIFESHSCELETIIGKARKELQKPKVRGRLEFLNRLEKDMLIGKQELDALHKEKVFVLLYNFTRDYKTTRFERLLEAFLKLGEKKILHSIKKLVVIDEEVTSMGEPGPRILYFVRGKLKDEDVDGHKQKDSKDA